MDTPEESATTRTRDNGTLIWQAAFRTSQDTAGWQDLADQPPHADLQAARRWLTGQLESGALVAGVYRPCRAHSAVSAKVETQTRVTLT